MFLNISLKSKSKWVVTVFIVTVVILSASIILMLKVIDKVKNGELLTEELDLSFAEYYTQYDMTVISNKNIHTYAVKEWHKEGVVTKLEYLDYMKNVVTITLQNNICNILNSGNTAKLVINNMVDNRNIASLSTFGYLYMMDCNSCSCSKTKYVKDNETTITVSLEDGCSCSCGKIAEDIGVAKLQLILVDGKPQNYTAYDKNKKEYISIVYNVFEKNIEI